jgi:hypothetical protein
MTRNPGMTRNRGMTGEHRHCGHWQVRRTPACLANTVIANAGMANIGMAGEHPRIRRALE